MTLAFDLFQFFSKSVQLLVSGLVTSFAGKGLVGVFLHLVDPAGNDLSHNCGIAFYRRGTSTLLED